MTVFQSRWRLVPVVGALILVGVAAVAYSLGTASVGSSPAQTAKATTVAGHREPGPEWSAPVTVKGATGQVAVTITKIDGSKLSVLTTDGRTRTIDASGATITKGGRKIALTDLEVGDQISFREARKSDGTPKITAIQVFVPTISGTVTAVAASSVTITQPGGSSRTLTLNGSTTYKEAGATVSRGALVVGVRISAQGEVDSARNFTATAVTIAQSSVRGTVVSKTETTLVVTAAGKTVKVDVSASTKYWVRGVAAPTLANIAVGDLITATGSLRADGSIDAAVVLATPKAQPGAGGSGGRGKGAGGKSGSPTARPSAAASPSSAEAE